MYKVRLYPKKKGHNLAFELVVMSGKHELEHYERAGLHFHSAETKRAAYGFALDTARIEAHKWTKASGEPVDVETVWPSAAMAREFGA